jgi:NADP-dependent 3-hydroxy acid dehydrogenase YdfG
MHKIVTSVAFLFSNAGTGGNTAGIENGNPDEWNTMLDVNITGLLCTAKASLAALKATQGHFILTSSVAGKIALPGSVYGATKWLAYGFGRANLHQYCHACFVCTACRAALQYLPLRKNCHR